MNIELFENDLPDKFELQGNLAIDTETLGLNLQRDRLCLIQICDENQKVALVKFKHNQYKSPNLKKLLADKSRIKIMHYARFDIASIYQYLGVLTSPVFCTKIASKLTRTYTDRHSLKELVSEICKTDLAKQAQSSNWAAEKLSEEQLIYAANDVIYLHACYGQLRLWLEERNRYEHALACFDFLATRVKLDLAGFANLLIFSHK